MDEVKKSEGHMTSPAAFVEGGIQDACDDACSICLEAFCESEPPSVTSCKHEFHLQCVLECNFADYELVYFNTQGSDLVLDEVSAGVGYQG